MTNITVRTETEQRRIPTVAQTWEPMRMMRNLLHWDPFQEMAPLLRPEAVTFLPDFEVKEAKEGYVFKADVPGVKQSDIEVSVSGNRITVSGKRDEEKAEAGETYYTCERSYGSFSRSFTLPENADTSTVNADLRDGVLTLTVGRIAEMQPKKIPIRTGASAAKPH